MKYLLTIVFIICNCILSQEPIKPRICGNIIDAETRDPIANANIFISNSSIGTASDKNGYFELRNLPYGRFEIIASVIGYEVLNAKIGIFNDSRRNIRFEMYKKPIQFPEIIVSAKETWKRRSQLKQFRRNLLGTSKNGKKTYIKNEEVIRFNNDEYGMLIAYADEPLEIINNSLGYRIQYVLKDFELTKGADYGFIEDFSMDEYLINPELISRLKEEFGENIRTIQIKISFDMPPSDSANAVNIMYTGKDMEIGRASCRERV